MYTPVEILTVEEMYEADRLAVEAGVPASILMENAGCGAAMSISRRFARQPVLILCGMGNNGGDGFVIGRYLEKLGWPVAIALLGNKANLKGEAAEMASRYKGDLYSLEETPFHRITSTHGLIVDALFGAGLDRPPKGAAETAITHINRNHLRCIAIDLPSGVSGNTGEVLGCAPACLLTLTFHRAKPAHLLYPAKALCGEVEILDIGIPPETMEQIVPHISLNAPFNWQIPLPKTGDHKYSRGHVLIQAGPMSGAARLAVSGARRVGAGLVSLIADEKMTPFFIGSDPGFILRSDKEFGALCFDEKVAAALLGPGGGVGRRMRRDVETLLRTQKKAVLDADALTSFEKNPDKLFSMLHSRVVLTPHRGEFARLFGVSEAPVTQQASAAAQKSGAVIVLKGADTIIAAPDGRLAINVNAPPWLATAGSGDVLAGFVLGLMGQGMAPFEAACAAVWIHGDSAKRKGPGLIAEDLTEPVPDILASFL